MATSTIKVPKVIGEPIYTKVFVTSSGETVNFTFTYSKQVIMFITFANGGMKIGMIGYGGLYKCFDPLTVTQVSSDTWSVNIGRYSGDVLCISSRPFSIS